MNELKELINSQWKDKLAMLKKASSPGMVTDSEVERAFMDQAYVPIEAKAGPLMNPEYRIGFEVVHKDDDNTRMVGIFAFKVGRELLFIPAFFHQGKIKGTDLMYQQSTKLLRPLNAEWVKLILADSAKKMGKLESEDITKGVPTNFNLDLMRNPPGMGKQAFVEICNKLGFADEVEDGLKLKSFLKKAGREATDFVNELIQRSDNWAEAMHVGYKDMSEWIPSSVDVHARDAEVTFKLAANSKMSAEEKDEFFKWGFAIQDKRAAEEKNDEVEVCSNYKEVSELGAHSVLSTEMESKPVLILSEALSHSDVSYVGENNYYVVYDVEGKGLEEVYTDGRKAIAIAKDALDGTEEPDVESKAVSHTSLTAGNAYLIVDKALTRGRKVFIKEKLSSSDKGAVYSASTWSDGKGSPITFTVDPKDKEMASDGIYSTSHYMILPLDLEKKDSDSGCGKSVSGLSFQIMKPSQFNSFLKYGSAEKNTASLKGSFGDYDLSVNGINRKDMSPAATAFFLMKEASLGKEAIHELLKEAEGKTIKFYFDKKATSLEFPDMEEDSPEFDPFFNVNIQQPDIQVLPAEGNYPTPRTLEELLMSEKRVDNVDALGGLDPLSLAQIAETTGVNSIFDHGVIGALVKTFDSGLLVESFLPDLEKALDKLGRLIFLFYWKPEDFIRMYGSNDQSGIENTFLSNFKAFGDIVLELKKQNKNIQGGVVSQDESGTASLT